jgi:predicted transport protein
MPDCAVVLMTTVNCGATKRLRLTLNVAFPEINDPRGICKDVSGLGGWGNGDVEVGLSLMEELPYILGLVRQSFEKQMGIGIVA